MRRLVLVLLFGLLALVLWRSARERGDATASLGPPDAVGRDDSSSPVLVPHASRRHAAAPEAHATDVPVEGARRAVDHDLARLEGTLTLLDLCTDSVTAPTGSFRLQVLREHLEAEDLVLREDDRVPIQVVDGSWEVELTGGAWVLPFDAALGGGAACFEALQPVRPTAGETLALEARVLHRLTLRVVEEETGADVLAFDLIDHARVRHEPGVVAARAFTVLAGGARWYLDQVPFGGRPNVSLPGELRGTWLRNLRSPYVLQPEADQWRIDLAVHARGRVLAFPDVDFRTCKSLEVRLPHAGGMRLFVPDCREQHRFQLTFLPVGERLGDGWPDLILEHGRIPLPTAELRLDWPEVPLGVRARGRFLSDGTVELEWDGLAVGRWRALLVEPDDEGAEHPLAKREFEIEPDAVAEVELSCPR